jgi:hypothetical protein
MVMMGHNPFHDCRYSRIRRVLFLLILATIALAADSRVLAAERTWTTETVGHGLASSIAIDSSQNLHLVYLTSDARLIYSFRPSASGKWFSEPILNSTHSAINVYPRIVVDSYDRPHVCVAMGSLQYLTYKGTSWKAQEVDPDSGTLSYHCSIALAPDGTPHITWYHEFLPGGKQFTHVRHAELVDGRFVVRSVDGGISGKWNSLVVDSAGLPHLSYSQWLTGGDIRYASWDGKDWTIESMPLAGKKPINRGYDNSLVLGPDGTPYISYLDEGALRYAYRKDGKWMIEKVSDISAQYDFYSGSTVMLLDHQGAPHIIYGDVGAVKHAYWDGKQWQVEVIESGGLGQYANVGATIGPDDTLYVSYSDPTDGQLKVAAGKVSANVEESKK